MRLPKVKILEADVKAALVKLLRHPVHLYVNPSGAGKLTSGKFVHFGVGRPGGADLIGWKTTHITPEMVGQRVAVFTAVELKRPGGGKLSDAQRDFLQFVADNGGLAIVADDAQEAAMLLGLI